MKGFFKSLFSLVFLIGFFFGANATCFAQDKEFVFKKQGVVCRSNSDGSIEPGFFHKDGFYVSYKDLLLGFKASIKRATLSEKKNLGSKIKKIKSIFASRAGRCLESRRGTTKHSIMTAIYALSFISQ
jgi:hypothetical protein